MMPVITQVIMRAMSRAMILVMSLAIRALMNSAFDQIPVWNEKM